MPHQTRGVFRQWVPKYTLNWVDEFARSGAWDFKVDGAYTDVQGIQWDIADSTIDGEGNAAIDLDVGGVVVATSANGEITFRQFIDTLPGLSDYALTDHLAILFEATSADQTTTNQVTSYRFGDTTFTDGAHQIFRFRNGGASEMRQNRKQTSPGNFDSAVVTLDAAYHDVAGFDISGDLCTPYYGASVPGAPFVGLTAGNAQSMVRQPDNSALPYDAAGATFQYAVNRNSGTNYTMTWVSCTIWREE